MLGMRRRNISGPCPGKEKEPVTVGFQKRLPDKLESYEDVPCLLITVIYQITD